MMRDLIRKHIEWDPPVELCKIEISKAYDILEWSAVDQMFVARGLPAELRKCVLASPCVPQTYSPDVERRHPF